MKRFFSDFMHRGFVALGFGPLVLAILYFVLGKVGVITSLSVDEVCIGIVSLSVLAFLAGGMNAIYQMERLPLFFAVLIHGIVLYLGYLITYLINDWLKSGPLPLLVFTGIFVLGYLVIWCIIYFIVQKRTKQINRLLQEKQEKAES